MPGYHHAEIPCYYRVSFYKKTHIPIIEHPKPYDEDQDWVSGEANIIEPLWTKGSILPQSMIDLLDTNRSNEEEADDEINLDVSSDDEIEDHDNDDDETEDF